MSDAPGLGCSSVGTGPSAYQEAAPHQEREVRFAADAAATLGKSIRENEVDVIIAVPPDALGILRHHCDRVMTSTLVTEVDKDLTGHPAPEIIRLILAQP